MKPMIINLNDEHFYWDSDELNNPCPCLMSDDVYKVDLTKFNYLKYCRGKSEERRHSSRSSSEMNVCCSSQQSLYPIIHIIQQHYSQPGNILLLMFNQENHSQAGRAS